MKSATIRALALTLSILSLTLCFVACDDGANTADGYVFRAANGTEILVGSPADDVIAALGTPLSEPIPSPSCGGFEGYDYDYDYPGFRVKTTPGKTGQMIGQIALTDDSIKTPEGLYIGMSRTEAEVAMKGKGTPEAVGDNLVYTKGSVKLTVSFRGDSVSGISYVAK